MDKETIADLKSDDRLKLKALYNEYRASFLGFGKGFRLDEDALSDVYQEAFLALRKKAINGKLNEVKCSMKTYLFGIGKFMIYDTLKEKKIKRPYQSHMHLATEDFPEIELENTQALTEEQQLLRRYFKRLGEKCRSLLTFYYYRGLSIKEIVVMGAYKDENSVKSSKSRCVKQLREMIKS